jgi:tRNA dimethylallyltransferase
MAETTAMQRSPLLCLTGPTASGKSAAALHIAQALGAEIISVDSALVYRGMDIGTAKPSAAERAEVAHHLLDVREVTEPYSAADFARDAMAQVAALQAKGKPALLVGGTMLYFKALLDGLHALPATDTTVRSEVAQRAAQEGWPALHAELARVDAATAARLNPNDAQRIGRALEVWLQTGKPLSVWTAEAPRPSGPRAVMVSLEPSDRGWLHQRIAQRFDAMLAQGFLDEVRVLMARPDVHADLPALRAVGYRQAWAALETEAAKDPAVCQAGVPLPPAALATLREQGIAATRQLAKRQLTWLRSLPTRQVVACESTGAIQQALALLQRGMTHD